LNADDQYHAALKAKYEGRVLSFGIEQCDADVRAKDIRLEQDHTDLMLCADKQTMPVRIRTVGRHNVYNALAAAAAALATGIPLDTVKVGLEEFRPVAMRSELREVNGRTILVDYYNANPTSVKAALETLASLKSGRRAIAVLGDMLELGPLSAALHREIGQAAVQLGIDLLIGVGPLGRYIAEGAIAAGMPRSRVLEAETTTEGAALLREWSLPGDMVLVKGSRGMKMEAVLEGF
jgi:UDP-N-acetylmuramyl pentapeptide synthase